jgi:hypothetical protein
MKLDNCSALVTGASRGLGAEFVKQLCARDHRVLAAVRDPSKADAARRQGATVVQLDVDRPETFDAFAASLDRPVDVLVNNAGIADTDATLASLTAETMERVHYPLQALLYLAALHRYLRGRLPGYDPYRHLAGVLYLFLRGMTGPATPRVDRQPCGVFAWWPPAALIVALSDLLDRGGEGA